MSKTILYYKACEENINSGQIEEWIAPLPAAKQQQIMKLRHQSAQFLSAAGLALVRHAVSHFTDIAFDPGKLEFPKNAKPRYPGGLDFNISHSGDIVCCAISESGKVGIDIEAHRQVTPTLMEKILGYQDSANPGKEAFFDIWTKSEAIIKAACQGSVFNMKDISLEENGGFYQGKFWYCYAIETTEDYTCHLATETENADISVHEITQL